MIIDKKSDQAKASFAGLLLLFLMSYMVDAVFNFPMERASMQVYFFILLVALMKIKPINWLSNRSLFHLPIKFILIGGLLFSCTSVVIGNKVYHSLCMQAKIANDWMGDPKPGFTYPSADKISAGLGEFPNIIEVGVPVACVKAKYYCEEKRFNEALRLLDNDKASNPFLCYAELLKARIFDDLNQPDSALYCANKGFNERPACIALYDAYM